MKSMIAVFVSVSSFAMTGCTVVRDNIEMVKDSFGSNTGGGMAVNQPGQVPLEMFAEDSRYVRSQLPTITDETKTKLVPVTIYEIGAEVQTSNQKTRSQGGGAQTQAVLHEVSGDNPWVAAAASGGVGTQTNNSTYTTSSAAYRLGDKCKVDMLDGTFVHFSSTVSPTTGKPNWCYLKTTGKPREQVASR